MPVCLPDPRGPAGAAVRPAGGGGPLRVGALLLARPRAPAAPQQVCHKDGR